MSKNRLVLLASTLFAFGVAGNKIGCAPEKTMPTMVITTDGFDSAMYSDKDTYAISSNRYTYYLLNLPNSKKQNYLFTEKVGTSDWQEVSFELERRSIEGKYMVLLSNGTTTSTITLLPKDDSNPTIKFSAKSSQFSKTIVVKVGYSEKEIPNPGFKVVNSLYVNKKEQGDDPRAGFLRGMSMGVLVNSDDVFAPNDTNIKLKFLDGNNTKGLFFNELTNSYQILSEGKQILDGDGYVLVGVDRATNHTLILRFGTHSKVNSNFYNITRDKSFTTTMNGFTVTVSLVNSIVDNTRVISKKKATIGNVIYPVEGITYSPGLVSIHIKVEKDGKVINDKDLIPVRCGIGFILTDDNDGPFVQLVGFVPDTVKNVKNTNASSENDVGDMSYNSSEFTRKYTDHKKLPWDISVWRKTRNAFDTRRPGIVLSRRDILSRRKKTRRKI